MRRPIGTLFFVLAAFLVLSACAGVTRVRQIPRDIQENVLHELLEQWEDYRIFATLWRGGQVRAIIFNPRDEDKRILADRWVQVQSKEEVLRLVLHIKSGQSPRVFKIFGPQDTLFGYLYAPNADLQIQALNDQTIKVYEIKPPNAPAA